MKTSLLLHFGLFTVTQLAAAIQCPPVRIFDGLKLQPGHCVSSNLCVGEDGTVWPYEDHVDSEVPCRSTLVFLRCPGDFETADPDGTRIKCEYSVLDFDEGGIMKRTCCENPHVVSEGHDDRQQQHPLVDEVEDIPEGSEGERREADPTMEHDDIPSREDLPTDEERYWEVWDGEEWEGEEGEEWESEDAPWGTGNENMTETGDGSDENQDEVSILDDKEHTGVEEDPEKKPTDNTTTDSYGEEPSDNDVDLGISPSGRSGDPSSRADDEDHNVPAKVQVDACVFEKDTTKIPKLDEHDPNFVWACYCNEGEELERIPLGNPPRPASNDQNGCPIIDLAIKQINGMDFTYFCDKKLSSNQYQNQTAELVQDCAGLCSADANCWGSDWVNGTCRLHADITGTKVIHGNSTTGWVALIKNNATTVQITDDVAKPILADPIVIAGDISGAPVSLDDEYFALKSPFPLTIYDRSSDQVYVSVNGLLSLDSGSGSYTNSKLPSSGVPSYAVMGLWGDLYIYQGTPQGLYYEVSGEIGSRTLIFEWYTSHYHQPNEYYHFTMEFVEANPGLILLKYYDVRDKGAQSTIGVQGGTTSAEFSYNSPVVNPGLQVTIDTTNNVITGGVFDL